MNNQRVLFRKNSRMQSQITKAAVLIMLILLSSFFIIPLIWIFLSSFKVDMEINQAGGFLYFPKTWTLGNYRSILSPGNKQLPVYNWFFNSIIVSGFQTILALLIYSMSAYAYAKMHFRFKNGIFLTILFLSTFPGITNIIPLYKEMYLLKWLNTPLALIVPGLSSVFNIFLIRQFLASIPNSLIESAKIDGAGELTVFFKIIMPLIKPVLIVVGLFTFTGSWNDFLWPSIAINNLDRLTLTAGLQLAKGVYGNQVARVSTIACISIIPMIIMYLFTQRYFVKGISIQGSVKE